MGFRFDRGESRGYGDVGGIGYLGLFGLTWCIGT
jgi:hypothetical protein